MYADPILALFHKRFFIPASHGFVKHIWVTCPATERSVEGLSFPLILDKICHLIDVETFMKSEYSIQDHVDIVKLGIAKKFSMGKPKKVIIVGAGLAGLAAGYELKRAGHTPIILEAQQRVGGRVYTLRNPFTEGLYAEVGAMRIPRAHTLTMKYVEKFGL